MSIRQAITSAIVESKGEADVNCIWVGLSAGVDSTVLLHALVKEAAKSDFPLEEAKIKAIHIHHGLSSNADDWAEQAKALCVQLSNQQDLTIECIVERVELSDQSSSGGLEQAARLARYNVFEKHCQKGDVLLQGHHLDDQIETFFMRAIRGSGLTGLSGIPQQRVLSRNNSCQVLRPLLSFEKTQLIKYAEQHQLTWVEDESNTDSQFDRNWWRNELLPQIWQRCPDKKQALSRTINNVQHEQTLLQELIIEKFDISESANTHAALSKIPNFDLDLIQNIKQSIALSYVRAWLAQHVDILPTATQMQSIYVDMIQARHDADPSFRWNDHSLYRYGGCLYLWNNDNWQSLLPSTWQGESLDCAFGQLTCREQKNGLAFGSYAIRFWLAGDVAKPVGRSTRKMKKWWQDYKVPSWARDSWPLIVDKETNQIVAVPGLFICQSHAIKENLKTDVSKDVNGNAWALDWCFKNQL